jgi:hypothetical protein
MKSNKKISKALSIILALFVLVSVFPVTAFASDERETEIQEAWEWFDSKPYSEQVRIIEEDMRMTLSEWEAASHEFKSDNVLYWKRWADFNATEQERHDTQQAEWDAYWEQWDSLSYSEQMDSLRQDWALHDMDGTRAAAQAAAAAAAQAAKPITLKVNGTTIPTDSPPVTENGRTLAPVRAVVEALGYIVSWDSATQTIEIYDLGTHDLRVSLKIGSNRAKVSTGIYGVMDERILDVPAKTINGRTMVPVRFIAESLGCTVGWDEATKTVSITQAAG